MSRRAATRHPRNYRRIELKKYLSYTTATSLLYLSFAICIASAFLPGLPGRIVWAFGILFLIVSIGIRAYLDGYRKGRAAAPGVPTVVINLAPGTYSAEDIDQVKQAFTGPPAEQHHVEWPDFETAYQPTAHEHRCQSCGEHSEGVFCAPGTGCAVPSAALPEATR